MAVQIKSLKSKDKLGRPDRQTTVHYIKVNRSNKKGAAEAVGGHLVENGGDFWISVPSTINDKKVELHVRMGDIVFRTNSNKRWQVGTPVSLKQRFPRAKFV